MQRSLEMMKTSKGNEVGAGEALAFEGDEALLGDAFSPDSHGRTTTRGEGYQIKGTSLRRSDIKIELRLKSASLWYAPQICSP